MKYIRVVFTYITNLSSFSQRVCSSNSSMLCLALCNKFLMSESSKNLDIAFRSCCAFPTFSIAVTSRFPAVWHKHVSLSNSYKKKKERQLEKMRDNRLKWLGYTSYWIIKLLLIINRTVFNVALFQKSWATNTPYRSRSIQFGCAYMARHKPTGSGCLQRTPKDRCTNWRRNSVKNKDPRLKSFVLNGKTCKWKNQPEFGYALVYPLPRVVSCKKLLCPPWLVAAKNY